MRISLKFDVESFDKVKIYSLKARDRKIIDKIFDDLHEKERFE